MDLLLLLHLLTIKTQVKALSPECDPSHMIHIEEENCLLGLGDYNESVFIQPATRCRGLWDHMHCWPHAAVGETVSQPCPKFLFSQALIVPPPSEGQVYKNCTLHGWSEPFPPFEIACELNATLRFTLTPHSHLYYYVKTMYTTGYSMSVISLTIAIAVLCAFRKLHCTRNYIHIQLFFSFILRAAFIFAKDSVLFSEDVYHCNTYPVGCKWVLLFSHYCILANYSWLLVEGHYLLTLLRVSFFSRVAYFWGYMGLGWGFPLMVTVAWAVAKYQYEDQGCWETKEEDWIWWILRIPVVLSISINFLFFLIITRVLVGKLRTTGMRGCEIYQYKKLAKSTFLLVSLLGLHFLLFAFIPDNLSDFATNMKNFVELAFASTQGFVVAVLYCFLNGEVQKEVQRQWRRWCVTHQREERVRPQRSSLSHTQASLLGRDSAAWHATVV